MNSFGHLPCLVPVVVLVFSFYSSFSCQVLAEGDSSHNLTNLSATEYQEVKKAFVDATVQYNQHDPPPPSLLSLALRHEIMTAYLQKVDKIWSRLTKSNGYTDSDVVAVKNRLLGLDGLTLETAIRDYYNKSETTSTSVMPDLVTSAASSSPKIPLRGGDSALGGSFFPDYGKLTIKKLIPAIAELSLYSEERRTTEKLINRSEISYTLPVGKYKLTVTAPHFKDKVVSFELSVGMNYNVDMKLIAASVPVEKKTSKKSVSYFDETTVRFSDDLLQKYRSELGAKSVLDYDYRKFINSCMSSRWEDSPADSYLLGSLMPVASLRGQGRGTISDGTGQPVNPAIQRPHLEILIDFNGLKNYPSLYQTINRSQYENEVALAVVQWANARRQKTVAIVDDLTSFSINEKFFVKMPVRAWAERKVCSAARGNMPFQQIGARRDIVVNNYVIWNQVDYENSRKDFPRLWQSPYGPVHWLPLGSSNDKAQLKIVFEDGDPDRGEVIAKAWANSSISIFVGAKLQGTSRIQDVFISGTERATHTNRAVGVGVKQIQRSFQSVITHEIGHFFWIRHLEDSNATLGAEELDASIMSRFYKDGKNSITPLDIMACNTSNYRSAALLGVLCDGLRARP